MSAYYASPAFFCSICFICLSFFALDGLIADLPELISCCSLATLAVIAPCTATFAVSLNPAGCCLIEMSVAKAQSEFAYMGQMAPVKPTEKTEKEEGQPNRG